MDVVYLCRPGRDNRQLRYSLRSLRNLDHDRVWIAGGWPDWVEEVGTIAVKRTGSKYEHTTQSLIAAAQHPEVSESFVLMNDDFFVMHPTTVETHHRGAIGTALDRRTTNHYSRHRLMMGDWLRAHGYPVLDYDLHVPMVMTKRGVQDMIAASDVPTAPMEVFTRTLYGNLHRLGGTQVRDPKIRQKRDEWSVAWTYLSTSDTSFLHTSAGSHIRTVFSEEGPYERGRTPHTSRHAAAADGRDPHRHRVLGADV